MAGRDLKNDIKVISGAGSVDTKGYESCTFAVTGADAGAIALALTDSDDNTTFTDVAKEHVIADKKTVLANAGDPFSVGYVGAKRYVKATLTGGTNGAVVAVLGHAVDNPHDAGA